MKQGLLLFAAGRSAQEDSSSLESDVPMPLEPPPYVRRWGCTCESSKAGTVPCRHLAAVFFAYRSAASRTPQTAEGKIPALEKGEIAVMVQSSGSPRRGGKETLIHRDDEIVPEEVDSQSPSGDANQPLLLAAYASRSKPGTTPSGHVGVNKPKAVATHGGSSFHGRAQSSKSVQNPSPQSTTEAFTQGQSRKRGRNNDPGDAANGQPSAPAAVDFARLLRMDIPE